MKRIAHSLAVTVFIFVLTMLTALTLSISNGCTIANASSPATGVTNGTYDAATRTATIDRVNGCTQQMLDSWLSTLPGPVERIVLTRNCYGAFIAPITFNVPVTTEWGFNLNNYSEQKSVTFNRGVTVNNATLGTNYMTIRGGLQVNGGSVNLQYANVSGGIIVNGGVVTALYSTINGNVTVNSGTFTLKISTLNGDIHENGGTVTATNVNGLGSSYHVATCTINGSVYRNAGNLTLTRNHVAAPVVVTGNIVIGTGTGTVTVGYSGNLDAYITLQGKLTAKWDRPPASGNQLNIGILGGDIDISLPLDSSHIYTQGWGFANSRSVKISAYTNNPIMLQGTVAGDVSIKYAPIRIVGNYTVRGNFTTQHHSVLRADPTSTSINSAAYAPFICNYLSSNNAQPVDVGSITCDKNVTFTFDVAEKNPIYYTMSTGVGPAINKATKVTITAPGNKASWFAVCGLPTTSFDLSITGVGLSTARRISRYTGAAGGYSATYLSTTYIGRINDASQEPATIPISNLTMNGAFLCVQMGAYLYTADAYTNEWVTIYGGHSQLYNSSLSKLKITGKFTASNDSSVKANLVNEGTAPYVYERLTLYGSMYTGANSDTTFNSCTIKATSTFNGKITINSSALDVTTINAPSELNNCTFTNKILTSSPALTFNAPATISTCTVSSGGMLFNSGASNSLIDRGNYSGTVACNGQHFVTVKRGTFTDGGTKATSTFIPHEDSEANVNNKVTTVKLSNPPVIIDWGEFPRINLDLDLAAPTISVRRDRLHYTRHQENTWRAQTGKSRTKAKAPALP